MKVMGIMMAGLLMAACGGDDDPPPTADRPDVVTIDAGVDPEFDAGVTPAQCEVGDALGDIPGDMAAAGQFPQDDTMPAGPKLIQIEAQLNQDPAPDLLLIQLWDGYGPFTGGAVTTLDAHPLTGDDADWTQCGACVAVAANLDAMGRPAQLYVAEAGTITITNVTGNVAGNLSNVSLRHVNIAGSPATQTDHPSGCDTTITSFAFDTAIQMP